MADGLRFKLEGFDELERELKKLGRDAEKVLRVGMAAGGRAVRDQARANLVPHKRSGALSKGLRVNSRIDRIRRSVRVTVRTSADQFYGLFLEFGATGVGRGRTGTVPAEAWLRRAVRQVGPQVYNKYAAERMRKRIAKIRAGK